MPNTDALTMDAGPDLDAIVETEVMGKPGCFVDAIAINGQWVVARTWLPEGYEPHKPPGGWSAGVMPPHYSTDIAYAWRVVERLRAKHPFRLRDLDGPPSGSWRALFEYGLSDIVGGGATAPLAIVRAALATVRAG